MSGHLEESRRDDGRGTAPLEPMDGSGGSGGKLARHLTLIRTGAAGAVVVALIAAVALTLSEGLGHRPGDGPGATLWG